MNRDIVLKLILVRSVPLENLPYIYVPSNAGERMFAAWRAGDLLLLVVATQDRTHKIRGPFGASQLVECPKPLPTKAASWDAQGLCISLHVFAPENYLAAPEDA